MKRLQKIKHTITNVISLSNNWERRVTHKMYIKYKIKLAKIVCVYHGGRYDNLDES